MSPLYLKELLTASEEVTLDKDYVLVDAWKSLAFGFYAKADDGCIFQSATKLVIDGDEHSISGLTSVLIANVSNMSLTIKNLTIKDSDIGNNAYNNKLGNAAVLGWVQNASVTIDNCKVIDSTVTETNDASATAFVGYVANTSASESIFNVTNCTVENVEIKAGNNAAAIVGHCSTQCECSNNYKIENCTVKGCKITGEKTEKTGTIVGTANNGGVLIINKCTVEGCKTNLEGVDELGVYGRIAGSTSIIIDDVTYEKN